MPSTCPIGIMEEPHQLPKYLMNGNYTYYKIAKAKQSIDGDVINDLKDKLSHKDAMLRLTDRVLFITLFTRP
ncbi:hypothetical protein Hdeb2414_s0013g00417731 [Helianthus debilis subsp. tardiflorus]